MQTLGFHHNPTIGELGVVQPRPFFVAQAPVQDKVLQVRERREDKGQADEDEDGGPAHRVFRRVVLPEELGPDDAREVGRHDHDGHGDGSLLGRLCVQGDPGAVGWICV